MSDNIGKSKEEYKEVIKNNRMKKKKIRNFMIAFVVGGLFCVVGEMINQLLLNYGLSATEATSYMGLILILLGGILTGVGIYDEVAQFAGAGIIVLIIGFANAIVAPAMEYRQEGYISGLGANIYSIAGPVLTYGIISAFLAGVIKLLII